jgi:hypothetical protein
MEPVSPRSAAFRVPGDRTSGGIPPLGISGPLSVASRPKRASRRCSSVGPVVRRSNRGRRGGARCRHAVAGKSRTPGGRTRGSGVCGLGCGGRIRTADLRVMSPTSCRCSTPRPRILATHRQLVNRSTRSGWPVGLCSNGGSGPQGAAARPPQPRRQGRVLCRGRRLLHVSSVGGQGLRPAGCAADPGTELPEREVPVRLPAGVGTHTLTAFVAQGCVSARRRRAPERAGLNACERGAQPATRRSRAIA